MNLKSDSQLTVKYIVANHFLNLISNPARTHTHTRARAHTHTRTHTHTHTCARTHIIGIRTKLPITIRVYLHQPECRCSYLYGVQTDGCMHRCQKHGIMVLLFTVSPKTKSFMTLFSVRIFDIIV